MMTYNICDRLATEVTETLVTNKINTPRNQITVAELNDLYTRYKDIVLEVGYPVSGDVITKELNK